MALDQIPCSLTHCKTNMTRSGHGPMASAVGWRQIEDVDRGTMRWDDLSRLFVIQLVDFPGSIENSRTDLFPRSRKALCRTFGCQLCPLPSPRVAETFARERRLAIAFMTPKTARSRGYSESVSPAGTNGMIILNSCANSRTWGLRCTEEESRIR
jgi:hypothetical protein